MDRRRVIVTADDFGLSLPVNAAIEDAHRRGILTTASLMVGAPATADAVRRARTIPGLRVGLHLALVNGRPVLPPAIVPDLVDGDGRFLTQLARAGVRFFFKPGVRRQLEAEIRAQFEAFAATGFALDHVNAHNHMHVHPTIFGLLLAIGRDYDMRAIRIPYEPVGPSWRSARRDLRGRFGNAVLLAPWLGLMRVRARREHLVCNDFIFGLNDTGRMTSDRVVRLIDQLPPGISELYFHPATEGVEFVGEYDALINPDVAAALQARGAEPTTYGGLAAGAA